jgi:septal ring factor EnvC (AmiA/AmiB activator)
MTAAMAEALAALEQIASRIEAMEQSLAQRQAHASRLKAEVAATIKDLDQLIGSGRHA